jgi:hypothetical protein
MYIWANFNRTKMLHVKHFGTIRAFLIPVSWRGIETDFLIALLFPILRYLELGYGTTRCQDQRAKNNLCAKFQLTFNYELLIFFD